MVRIKPAPLVLLFVLGTAALIIFILNLKPNLTEYVAINKVSSEFKETFWECSLINNTSFDEKFTDEPIFLYELLKTENPDIQKLTLISFVLKNYFQTKLNLNNIDTECTLRSKEELKNLLETGKGLEVGTIMYVSRVGTNYSKNEALLYIEIIGGNKKRVQEYVHLKKTNDQWKIQ